MILGWPFSFGTERASTRRSDETRSSPGGRTCKRFRQINRPVKYHHDALEFPDGRIVLLTRLCKGQHATVLQLPVTSPVTANEAQRHGSLVA
jgi:hypothetical protein